MAMNADDMEWDTLENEKGAIDNYRRTCDCVGWAPGETGVWGGPRPWSHLRISQSLGKCFLIPA